MMSGRQERTESCVSETDFSPLVEVRNMSEMEYSPSEETPDTQNVDKIRKTIHLVNEKDEGEDGEDEVFNLDKEKTIESQGKGTERKEQHQE